MIPQQPKPRELAGLGRTLRVAATDDVDEIIGLHPDCVSYMPLTPDIEIMARLLGAINAIPAVVAAPPGIVTYADLPPIVAPLAAP